MRSPRIVRYRLRFRDSERWSQFAPTIPACGGGGAPSDPVPPGSGGQPPTVLGGPTRAAVGPASRSGAAFGRLGPPNHPQNKQRPSGRDHQVRGRRGAN